MSKLPMSVKTIAGCVGQCQIKANTRLAFLEFGSLGTNPVQYVRMCVLHQLKSEESHLRIGKAMRLMSLALVHPCPYLDYTQTENQTRTSLTLPLSWES